MAAIVATFFLWMLAEKYRLPGSIMWRAARSTRREQARRATATTVELVQDARRGVRSMGLERFEASKTLFREGEWSDAHLLAVLNALYAALAAEDKEKNEHGHGSLVFFFHDGGLASICEALAHRTR
jgi:hypothetical protein